ncbi:MAG: hypothetical protein LBU17_00585 [Treponema sp.]|jgi:hypothetical protein|nr:hypothetical protein [Treponema sp.]
MELLEMTVTAGCTKKSPYLFTAKDGTASHPVTMVMPLGGVTSGLYRSPQIGELVLVGEQSSGASTRYYLMGYLPSDTVSFFAKNATVRNSADEAIVALDKALAATKMEDAKQFAQQAAKKAIEAAQKAKELDSTLTDETSGLTAANTAKTNATNATTSEKAVVAANAAVMAAEKAFGKTTIEADTKHCLNNSGEVFRYKKTGRNTADDAYSEIGFYSDTTQWKKDGEGDPPKIDRINIQSTGDIHEKAQNYHQICAKRLELLANCPAADHSNPDGEQRPFEDRPGDDSDLYAGDAHIRAKNRIVIKAGREIELQVGRSKILITDAGIELSSRKTRPNVPTSWDTILKLSPQTGISMFGSSVDITAAYKYAIKEKQSGSSISSMAGVMRFSAKDILFRTVTALSYTMANAVGLFDLATNIGGMSKALTSGEADGLAGLLAKAGVPIGSIAATIVGLIKNDDILDKDPISIFVAAVGGVLDMVDAVFMVLDMFISVTYSETHDSRSKMILAHAVIQSGLLGIMAGFISAGSGPFSWTHRAAFHLRGYNAQVVTEAKTVKRIGADGEAADGPLAAVANDAVDKITKKATDKMDKIGEYFSSGKLAKGVTIGSGVAVLGALGGIGLAVAPVALGDMSKKDNLDKSVLDQLKEL